MQAKHDIPVFVQYFTDVLDGKVVAGKKIKQLSAIILERFTHPGKYHYDDLEAQRHVDFIQKFCRVPAGRNKMGEGFILETFQRAMLEVVFGFVDDNGLRQYQEVFWVLGRKNGKTTLCAAIGHDLLINDREGAPEVYFAATSKDQSNKGFNAAYNMMKLSPMLSKHLKKTTSGISFPYNLGIMRSLASNTNALDGLDVHGAILDELGAMKDRAVYDLIKQAISGREQPLIFEITTNGFVRNSIFDAQYQYSEKLLNGEIEDERFLPIIYELDDAAEWKEPDKWVKANPGLGTIKSEDYLANTVEKAKNDPSFLPTVLVKDFNITQNFASAWLSASECINEYVPDKSFKEMGFKYGIIGIDAANTTDLNSACVFCMLPGDDKIYKHSMYWVPEDFANSLTIDGNRRERDSAPYLQWIANGRMRTYPGNKVGRDVFANWIRELIDEYDIYPYTIGYDPWGFTDDRTLEELCSFVGKDNFLPVRQGKYTMSQPMKEFKADLAKGLIVDWKNPIDIWCRSNAAVKVDSNGELSLVKNLDPRNRIDGLAAELDAYIALKKFRQDYEVTIEQ